MIDSFPLAYAVHTAKNYVCSTCWGELEVLPNPADVTLNFVYCKRCGKETRGYVSRYFADTRRSESIGELRTVTRYLQGIGLIPKPPKRAAKTILKDLGF